MLKPKPFNQTKSKTSHVDALRLVIVSNTNYQVSTINEIEKESKTNLNLDKHSIHPIKHTNKYFSMPESKNHISKKHINENKGYQG